MAKATPREIMQSLKDHALTQDDQGKAPQRHANRGLVAHTSTGDPRVKRPMLNRKKADPRDLYWVALGKQVAAGARITVR